MNAIFLDVDGVLNSINKLKEVYYKTKKAHSGYNYPFDENALENLKEIVIKTNSKIIITSTWRKNRLGKMILLKKLKEYGIDDKVIGYTDVMNDNREVEIKEYLRRNPNIKNFIIIDDSSKLVDLIDRLVKTDINVGLTKENKDEAIKKLEKRIFNE